MAASLSFLLEYACRSAISAAQKDGLKVEELGKLTPQLVAEMKGVDKAWVDARGKHAGPKRGVAALLLGRSSCMDAFLRPCCLALLP